MALVVPNRTDSLYNIHERTFMHPLLTASSLCCRNIVERGFEKKPKAVRVVFPKQNTDNFGREGVNLLRAKKRQRRRGESQRKTEDVRW